MMYTVYCHTNKENNKKYVGITTWKPEKRWSNGRGYRNNSYFYHAIKKYGWDNFIHEILFTNLSKEEAIEMETKLIKDWNLIDREKGYNIEGGGLTHQHMSVETRAKLSRSHTGKKASEEAKKNMSIAQQKRITPEDRLRRSIIAKRLHKDPIYKEKVRNSLKSKYRVGQYDKQENLIQTYESLYDAVKITGFDKSNIIACFNGKQKTCHGFVWKKIWKGD